MISWKKLGKWTKLLFYASLLLKNNKKWVKIIKKQMQNKYYIMFEEI